VWLLFFFLLPEVVWAPFLVLTFWRENEMPDFAVDLLLLIGYFPSPLPFY